MIQFRKDLYQLLPSNSHVAELGCAEGFFSADMLRWGVNKLYMVDVWSHVPNVKGDANSPQKWHDKNYAAAVDRVKEFENKYLILRGFTNDMVSKVPDNSLNLVYLDADHSYEGVITDIINWFPKLKVGGIMAFHDYEMEQYGVKKAVQEFTKDKYTVHLLPEHKKEDAGAYFFKT